MDPIDPRPPLHGVAPLGIRFDGLDPAPPASAERPLTIGYLARIAPEKGLHLLASAYIRLRRELGLENARLEAAGYLAPEHRTYLDAVGKALAAVGLDGEFRCLSDSRTQVADVLAATALLGCAVGLVVLDLFVMQS